MQHFPQPLYEDGLDVVELFHVRDVISGPAAETGTETPKHPMPRPDAPFSPSDALTTLAIEE